MHISDPKLSGRLDFDEPGNFADPLTIGMNAAIGIGTTVASAHIIGMMTLGFELPFAAIGAGQALIGHHTDECDMR